MAYVCYQKLSKKKRREIDQAKRATWGSVSPVTKKVASEKVYNRKRTQRWQAEATTLGSFLPFCAFPVSNAWSCDAQPCVS